LSDVTHVCEQKENIAGALFGNGELKPNLTANTALKRLDPD